MAKVVQSTILDVPAERVWEIVRDFNGFDRWHPAIGTSRIERGRPADTVGAVRHLRLEGGAEVREQLLTLSDMEMTYSYCLLDTPIPLFNYVAHLRLLPVTDGDRTFWQWEAGFTTRPAEAAAMSALVRDGIMLAGMAAIRRVLEQPR